jgi:hypothetical protein
MIDRAQAWLVGGLCSHGGSADARIAMNVRIKPLHLLEREARHG